MEITIFNHDYPIKYESKDKIKLAATLVESMKKTAKAIEQSSGNLFVLSTYKNITTFVGGGIIKHISDANLFRLLDAKVKKLGVLFESDAKLDMHIQAFKRRCKNYLKNCQVKVADNEKELITWLKGEEKTFKTNVVKHRENKSARYRDYYKEFYSIT